MHASVLICLNVFADVEDGYYSTKLTQHIPSNWTTGSSLLKPNCPEKMYKEGRG